MKVNECDKQYYEIVKHIQKDEEFMKIANHLHHGTDRLTHSRRVSYFSYKLAKKLKLDYKTAAVAGLLHDFYGCIQEDNFVDYLKANYQHPQIAAKNAVERFNVSEKEKNIIETHMFPMTIKPTKHIEGWVINVMDKIVGTYEYGIKFRYKFSLWFVFLFNVVKIGLRQ